MKTKMIIKVILAIVLGTGSVLVGKELYYVDCRYRQSNEQQSKPNIEDTEVFKRVSEALPPIEEENDTERGDLSVKYADAKNIASKAIGWIYIPKTNVDYPVMHGDNTYYLNRTWDDKPSAGGAIFLDQYCTGFNKISMIHGHNMANGSMFATIQVFYNNGILNDDDIIYIYDGTTEHKYRIFSTFRTNPNIQIRLALTKDDDIKNYAKELQGKSHSKSDYEVNSNQLLVLNTCCSDGTGEHFLVIGQEVL